MVPTDARGVWSRPFFVPGGEAGIATFLAFLEQPVNGRIDLREEGWPLPAPPPGVGTESIVVAESPAWAAWVQEVAPQLAEPFASRVRGAPFIAVVSTNVADPADLGYLQAAWAVARWACRRGAFVLRDEAAGTWSTPEEVLDLDAYGMATRFQLFVEDVPGGVGVWTQGLRKAGRRELVTFVPPEQVDLARPLLIDLAAGLIAGRQVASREAIEHPLARSMSRRSCRASTGRTWRWASPRSRIGSFCIRSGARARPETPWISRVQRLPGPFPATTIRLAFGGKDERWRPATPGLGQRAARPVPRRRVQHVPRARQRARSARVGRR